MCMQQARIPSDENSWIRACARWSVFSGYLKYNKMFGKLCKHVAKINEVGHGCMQMKKCPF